MASPVLNKPNPDPSLEELEADVLRHRQGLAAAESKLTARLDRMESDLRDRRAKTFPEAVKKAKPVKAMKCSGCGDTSHTFRKCPKRTA